MKGRLAQGLRPRSCQPHPPSAHLPSHPAPPHPAACRVEYLSKLSPSPASAVPSVGRALVERMASRLLVFFVRHAALLRPLGTAGKLQLAKVGQGEGRFRARGRGLQRPLGSGVGWGRAVLLGDRRAALAPAVGTHLGTSLQADPPPCPSAVLSSGLRAGRCMVGFTAGPSVWSFS